MTSHISNAKIDSHAVWCVALAARTLGEVT